MNKILDMSAYRTPLLVRLARLASVYADGWVAYGEYGHESGTETGEEGKAIADKALVWLGVLP